MGRTPSSVISFYMFLPRARSPALAATMGLSAALCGLNLSGGSISPPSAWSAMSSPPAPGVPIESWSPKNLGTQEEQDREIARLRESGAEWVRVIAMWSGLERDGKGRWTEPAFATLDRQLARLQAAGIKVVLVAGPGTPLWASADPRKFERNAAGNTGVGSLPTRTPRGLRRLRA